MRLPRMRLTVRQLIVAVAAAALALAGLNESIYYGRWRRAARVEGDYLQMAETLEHYLKSETLARQPIARRQRYEARVSWEAAEFRRQAELFRKRREAIARR